MFYCDNILKNAVLNGSGGSMITEIGLGLGAGFVRGVLGYFSKYGEDEVNFDAGYFATGIILAGACGMLLSYAGVNDQLTVILGSMAFANIASKTWKIIKSFFYSFEMSMKKWK